MKYLPAAKLLGLAGLASVALFSQQALSADPCPYSALGQSLKGPDYNPGRNLFKEAEGLGKFGYRSSPIGSDWYNNSPADIDPRTGKAVEGSSVDKVYEKAPTEVMKEVIVAVIDSGMDITHVDLKDNIWVNTKEIPGNCIDDDKNGYVDDVHGWNYVVNKEGKSIDGETLEVTREFHRLEKAGETESDYYKKVKKAFSEGLMARKQRLALYKGEMNVITTAAALFNDDLDSYTLDEVKGIVTKTAVEAAAKADLVALYEAKVARRPLKTVAALEEYVQGAVAYYQSTVDFHYNLELAKAPQRADDPDFFGDFKTNPEKLYGNNDVTPVNGDETHATHVAGIIGAVRDNATGIRGVAAKVKIMALRAVPNGDEADKDVYHAVRYAVDNGARIINMSFGKGFARNADKVIEAFAYAASKGVLIVHSAGNSADDNDVAVSYPERKLADKNSDLWAHWLEVGASGPVSGPDLRAYFSSFGKTSVDIFAPGYKVKSSINGDQYAYYSGTSMASPVVSGTLALMMSVDPEIPSSILKRKLMETARQYEGVTSEVVIGGEKQTVPFKDLSISGGVADADTLFNAIN